MTHQQFREDVFDLQKVTPALKAKFQKEIREIVERPLKPWERIFCILLIPAMLGLAIFCAIQWLRPHPDHSQFIRSEIGISFLIVALLAGWLIYIVKKGRHVRNSLIVSAIAFGMFVAMTALSLAMTGTVEADLLAATMVVGFATVWDRVKMAEMHIRENILRQELRLVEFSERFDDIGAGESEE